MTSATSAATGVCWHSDGGFVPGHDCEAPDRMLFTYGRCRSGQRWFWAAECYDWRGSGDVRSPHGWSATEEEALQDARSAVENAAGSRPAMAYIRQGVASRALKSVNAAKRRARPSSGERDARPMEYLYEPWSWYGDDSETHKGITEIPVVKRTAKRIYIDTSSSWDRREGTVTLGYIGRAEMEDDTRCPGPSAGQNRCEHRHYRDHGYPPGETWHQGSVLFSSREAAEGYLYEWDRELERQRREREPDIKRLRQEMADAHPDRGGTDEGFIAARKRYKQALREAYEMAGAHT